MSGKEYQKYLVDYHETYYVFEQLMISTVLKIAASSLTIKELIVLDKIKQLTKEDKNIPSIIALETGYSKSAMSNLLQRLENKEYISRTPDLEDQRKLRVTITEEANKFLTLTDAFMLRLKNYFLRHMGILGMRQLLVTSINLSNTISTHQIDFKFYKLNHYKEYFQSALNNLFIAVNKQEQDFCSSIHDNIVIKDLVVLQTIELDEKRTLVDLSQILLYQPQTIHKILGKLEGLDYVVKSESTIDLRKKLYHLTDLGKDVLGKFIANRMYVLNMIEFIDKKRIIKLGFKITKEFLLEEQENM